MDQILKGLTEFLPVIGPWGFLLGLALYLMWKGEIRFGREYRDIEKRLMEAERQRDEWLRMCVNMAKLSSSATVVLEKITAKTPEETPT